MQTRLVAVHLGIGGQVADWPLGVDADQGGVVGVQAGAHQAGGLGRLPEGLTHQPSQVWLDAHVWCDVRLWKLEDKMRCFMPLLTLYSALLRLMRKHDTDIKRLFKYFSFSAQIQNEQCSLNMSKNTKDFKCALLKSLLSFYETSGHRERKGGPWVLTAASILSLLLWWLFEGGLDADLPALIEINSF